MKGIHNTKKLRIIAKHPFGTNYKLVFVILNALALTLIINTVALAQEPTPTDDEVNRIAKQLYCPVCESTPLDVCPTEACRQWRDLIREMLAQGKSETEIKQYFVEHYGPQVLNEPPNRFLTYVVPIGIFLLGAFMLFHGFQVWMKPAKAESGKGGNEAKRAKPAQDAYIALIEEELKKRN